MGNEKLVLQLICLIYILAEYIIFPEMWWSQCRVLSAHQRRPIQNSDLLEPWLLNSWALLYWLDDKIFKNDLNICQTALFALVKKNKKNQKNPQNLKYIHLKNYVLLPMMTWKQGIPVWIEREKMIRKTLMSSGTVYLEASINCRFSDSLDRVYFWCHVRLGPLWRGMTGTSCSDIAH